MHSSYLMHLRKTADRSPTHQPGTESQPPSALGTHAPATCFDVAANTTAILCIGVASCL